MISKPANIERVKARARLYWPEYAGDFTKVCHHTLATYDDSSMDEALAYVDSMGGVESESDDDSMEVAEVEAPKKESKVAEPFDSKVTIGKVDVLVLDRALKHIPPTQWPGFANWIAKGSLGTRISEAGTKIKDWYQVTLTSDEVLDKTRANYRVRIVCSWSDDTLTVYHAHPDLPSYPDYF